jgi:hypothetical protein
MEAHAWFLYALLLMFHPQSGILRDPAGGVNKKRPARWDMNMLKRGKRACGWMLVALAALAGGCAKQDKERLAVVGSRLTARADGWTSDSRAKLTRGWQALRTNWEELSLDARVTARLRWDKTLAEAPIQIETNGTVVRLKGGVRDAAQRRRAVELASTTVGVERVAEEWEP